jgi:hypothetical protein
LIAFRVNNYGTAYKYGAGLTLYQHGKEWRNLAIGRFVETSSRRLRRQYINSHLLQLPVQAFLFLRLALASIGS